MAAAAHCLACEVSLRDGGEAHHFPVPRVDGGTSTVPLCRGCHDKVDRFRMESWGGTELLTAVMGLVEKATPSERCFLLKMVSLDAHREATHNAG